MFTVPLSSFANVLDNFVSQWYTIPHYIKYSLHHFLLMLYLFQLGFFQWGTSKFLAVSKNALEVEVRLMLNSTARALNAFLHFLLSESLFISSFPLEILRCTGYHHSTTRLFYSPGLRAQ